MDKLNQMINVNDVNQSVEILLNIKSMLIASLLSFSAAEPQQSRSLSPQLKENHEEHVNVNAEGLCNFCP